MQKCDLLYLNLSFIEQHYSEDISIEEMLDITSAKKAVMSSIHSDF